jgi:hypothetical protein
VVETEVPGLCYLIRCLRAKGTPRVERPEPWGLKVDDSIGLWTRMQHSRSCPDEVGTGRRLVYEAILGGLIVSEIVYALQINAT